MSSLLELLITGEYELQAGVVGRFSNDGQGKLRWKDNCGNDWEGCTFNESDRTVDTSMGPATFRVSIDFLNCLVI